MKKLLIVFGLVVALAVPFTAFAATSETPAAQAIRSFCRIDFSKLTDEQKADLQESADKMIELRKENIKKMVENGSITKEQGDAALERIEDMAEYRQENGFAGGSGMKGGRAMGRGFGRGHAFAPDTTN